MLELNKKSKHTIFFNAGANAKTLYAPAFFIFFSLFTVFSLLVAAQENALVKIGVNERLGETINLNYTFVNEQGDSVLLASLVDKTTILSFVYYTCPGICNPLLGGLQEAVDKVDMQPGKDFKVITISMNVDETFSLAKQKKKNYLAGLRRPFPAEQWHWLTGDSANIHGITGETGFAFKRSGDDFAHSAVLIILSKEGKISRYLYGTNFNQFTLKMALLEAGQGIAGPTIAKVIEFCFSYDPQGRTYVFNILKVSASVILLTAGIFLVYLITSTKKKNVTIQIFF
jgi:protein SCO1/2